MAALYSFWYEQGKTVTMEEMPLPHPRKEERTCRNCTATGFFFDQNFGVWLCPHCVSIPRCGVCEAIKHVLKETGDEKTYYCPPCEPGEWYAVYGFEEEVERLADELSNQLCGHPKEDD